MKDDRMTKALRFAKDCILDEAGPPGARPTGDHKLAVQVLTELIGLRRVGRLVVKNGAQGFTDDDGVVPVVRL